MGRAQGIRIRSSAELCGLPLFDIAVGGDAAKGELRGHARGIIAIGDIATGWLAIGGIARGIVALGGIAVGGISLGGCSLGLIALGGVTVGGVAIGGAAFGAIAMGGCAAGYYAIGGGAFGKYVVSAAERSPEAVEFFKRWIPWLR
jgi:hypothetical protein